MVMWPKGENSTHMIVIRVNSNHILEKEQNQGDSVASESPGNPTQRKCPPCFFPGSRSAWERASESQFLLLQ
jgi:hypothetical protein